MQSINCIGFVMDGNRRWAREHELPTLEGHKKGFDKFNEVIRWIHDAGIKNAIFYAFSTENWNRSEQEVSYLMDLFEQSFQSIEEAHEKKIKMRFLGQIERLPKTLQKVIAQIELETKEYTNGTVGIAVSYGGRADIVQAANKLLERGTKNITQEEFEKELWTHDMPDPDLIVRTGDAMRLSNFLTWQSAYSELYFTKTSWPDFNKKEFDAILEEYEKRERRLGK